MTKNKSTNIKCHGFYIEQGEIKKELGTSFVNEPSCKYFLCLNFSWGFMNKNFRITRILSVENVNIII